MKKETAGLIRRARNGDMDAFAAVFEELRPMIYAVAYRLVGPNDANDVVMDTYLKAWQALPRFRGASSLKTWLYRITNNCALDRIRRQQRERRHVVEDDPEATERPLTDPAQEGADEELARRETRDMVRRAMGRLGDLHRVALELRYSDGLSYAEIAAATGVSMGTVMSRLFNAKRKLRQAVAEETES
jgi:RNA polymerase sigma-70 factor (ECF subfamily)